MSGSLLLKFLLLYLPKASPLLALHLGSYPVLLLSSLCLLPSALVTSNFPFMLFLSCFHLLFTFITFLTTDSLPRCKLQTTSRFMARWETVDIGVQ